MRFTKHVKGKVRGFDRRWHSINRNINRRSPLYGVPQFFWSDKTGNLARKSASQTHSLQPGREYKLTSGVNMARLFQC